MVLSETKHTIAFLSSILPAKEDGHILIIPKIHYNYIEDIPKNILHEIIEHVTKLVKVIRKEHKGCNILLNDGRSAGQTIFHTHFHIIPRKKNDHINIESYKTKEMSITNFIKLHQKIKNNIK